MTTETVALPKDAITPKQVARKLGCHVAQIYRWIGSGRLRAFKVGGRHFVALADAEGLVRLKLADPPVCASCAARLGLPYPGA